MAVRKIETPMKVNGSVGLTFTSSDLIIGVTKNDPTTPIRTPMMARRIPCTTTSLSTSPCPAPRAMRTPISCVRCATEYDSTP